MKKIKIFTFLLIFVICMTTISITSYASEKDYFELNYHGYQADLQLNITFEECAIDPTTNTWCDVVAYFYNDILGQVRSDYLFLAGTNESDYDYVYFYYDYDEESEWYKRRFLVLDKEYSPVSCNAKSSVTINSEDVFYLQYVIGQDLCEHEYVGIENKLDDYCYCEKCVYCGYKNFRDHDYILLDKSEPTCTAKGYETYQCDLVGCGHTITRELPQIAHSFNNGEVIIEPTCTVGGMREYTCEICEYSYQTPIYALGHDFNSFGNCRRAGCSHNYFGIAPDFSWLTDWFSKGQETIDDVGTKIEEWTEDVFGGDTTTPTDDPIEEIKDLLDKSGQFIEKLISLIMGAVVGYIVVKCIPIVVAFFKGLFGINDKRK